jgi:DNA-binding NtrC family response regulator
VRELANVLERSAILVDGNQIDGDDLVLLPQTDAGSPDTPTKITDIERDAIERLGMPLRTFYDKLKRYGIS